MDEVTIYTDGACSGNPGPGGYGAILLCRGVEKEIVGAEASTTNNRMELTAVIKGLEALKRPCSVNVYSDSAYVVNSFTLGWVYNWHRRGWINNDNKEVLNKDLWMRLYDLTRIHHVTWYKVKGHADNEYNNRADRLAVEAYKKLGQSAQGE
ncbi:MAG: ribonuclease HI [Eubacteriales bacterium]|nr:ribonuclease HI [Eubacteriales bacterium]